MPNENSKYEQIRAKVCELFPDDLDEKDVAVEKLINSFCKIKEIESDMSEPRFDLVVAKFGDFGLDSAISVKPGNVVLNWRRLFTSIPNITLTGAGVIAQPLLWPFAALVIWNEIWSHLKIELSWKHAAVITALWDNRDDNKMVEKTVGFEASNEILNNHNQSEISLKEFNELLADLVRMGCVKEKDNGKVWLCEWVKKSFK